MDLLSELEELSKKTPSRILLVVLDGVGGLPKEPGGPTELAAAKTPNLDRLAEHSALGLFTPVAPGIAPGSGPGHLSIFGYDPFKYQVGRGVLSALGLGIPLGPRDVAVRGNFATLNPDGTIQDRRAGRPPTEENRRVIEKLKAKIQEIDGVRVELYTESEHRFVLVLRGEGLGARVTDTDPQSTGVPPRAAEPEDPGDAKSAKTARILNRFVELAREALKDEPVINGVLLRGVSQKPDFPKLPEVAKVRAAAIASYPMYRGVAELVGMEALSLREDEEDPDRPRAKLEALKESWGDYDFFYLHFKKTDSKGEDGDFEGKVERIELFDALLPELLALKPDVLLITGDHSTPAVLKAHSWHPVPVLLHAPYLRSDAARRFTEDEAAKGSLGALVGPVLLPLMLAHAGKLQKFGA